VARDDAVPARHDADAGGYPMSNPCTELRFLLDEADRWEPEQRNAIRDKLADFLHCARVHLSEQRRKTARRRPANRRR
jgi:hypothetical protein